MNRLQKKCFIVSASLHGLLLVVLVFGSALSWERKNPLPPAIKLFDPKLVTDAMTRGGDPTAQISQPPPAAPLLPRTPAPAPQSVEVPKPPVPAATREVPPVPKPVKPVKPVVKQAPVVIKPEPPKPVKPPKPALTPEEIAALNKPTVRSTKDAAQAAKAAEEAAAAKRYAENQQRIGKALGQSAKNLGKEISGPTEIKAFNPNGNGDPLAANYQDLVRSIYTSAWTPPPDLSDESATVIASVTIDREGKVMSAQITKRSGNAAMDRSIQATLDNVTVIAPFPAGAKEQQRSYFIKFNLQAKRSLG